MRDQYTHLEYLQIAVFLVGTPLAALMGAMMGLVGKWKEGRVFTAALMGLGSAAFVTVVLFFTFLVIHWQMQASRQSILPEFFDSYFGQRIAILAAIATAVIAFLAGIGLRSRRNENGHAASFSMRQLLLLQLFAFIALGCWTGMRFFALNSGTTIERARRLWAQRNWDVSGEANSNPSNFERIFSRGDMPDLDQENRYLHEIAQLPGLKVIQLANIPHCGAMSIDELTAAKQLQTLYLSYSMGNIDQREINTIGTISPVKVLSLRCSGNYPPSLAPISKLSNLEVLLINDGNLAPVSLGELKDSTSLRRLFINYVTNSIPGDPIHWPKGLEELQLRTYGNVARWSLVNIAEASALKSLWVATNSGSLLSRTEVEAISRCENLESLTLDDALAESDLERLGSLAKLRVLTITETTAKRTGYYRSQLQKIAMLPSLTNLNCDHQIIIEENEWAQKKPFPTLEEMDQRREDWGAGVNAARAKAGLKTIRITFTQNVGPAFVPGGSGNAAPTASDSNPPSAP